MKGAEDRSVEAALKYIATSAEDFARAKARVKYIEQFRKTLKARAYLEARGETVSEREAKAYTEPEYVACLESYKDAVYDHEILVAKRLRAELVIEVWRTLNANKRAANIT